MKRKFEVRWYECNLTKPKKCRFFTRIGAEVYAACLKVYDNVESKIYEL